jgi:hypothetical protein
LGEWARKGLGLREQGKRVIYIGESQGHTGDDELHLILETDWAEVDSRHRCSGGVCAIG